MFILRLLAVLLLVSSASASASAADVVVFSNGRWFDGRRFVSRTMYSVDGVLHTVRPAATTPRVIDLGGKFVIPPFAEAHNHWLEPQSIAEYNRKYLGDGVFYVMDQSNVPLVASKVREQTNRADAVDYRVALLGITGPGGHPIQIVKQFIKFGILPAEWDPNGIDRNAVLVVTNEHDLEERWPLLAEARTDFVKLFLLYSEEYEQRKNDPKDELERGLDPTLVPWIVARAHRDGLRVSAHIYSATDFRNALNGGVDLIAHMPGTGAGEHKDLERYRITDADARLAASKGVSVITTMGWIDDLRETEPEQADRVLREVILPNLRLLLKHRVPLLIGSDQFRETPLPEVFLLAKTGLFTNAAILRIATMDTPRAIFPERAIGRLDAGGEASFLVLGGDPLQKLENIRTIVMRVKHGAILAATNR